MNKLDSFNWMNKLQRWIVWRLPDWVIYWAVARVWAHATQGRYFSTDCTSITVHEALNRWEKF